MRGSRRISFGLVFLLLLGILLTVGANAWKSSLVVQKVAVEGNRVVATNEILQLAHVSPGMKLYDLDLTVIQRDVASHHFLRSAVVERDLPSTIRITVEERRPLALLRHNEILYVDRDGVVLPHQVSRELFDLPIITGLPASPRPRVGTTLTNQDLREALSILIAAEVIGKELYHLISEVQLRNGGDLVLYTAEGGIPVLYGRGNAAEKLMRLEAFWNAVVREQGTQHVEYVDVRFEDQIVVRWKSLKDSNRPRLS